MDIQRAMDIAREAGFEVVARMDPQKLNFLEAVRDMCKTNKCRRYDTRWVCPPACGTIEEMPDRFHKYKDGVIFQTICRMNDEYDLDAMHDVMENHKLATKKLMDALHSLIGQGEDLVPFGNDGCGQCEECTYPDQPCRYPERAFPSLSACGLIVSDVCKDNDVQYYYGRNTVAYTGAFVFNPKV